MATVGILKSILTLDAAGFGKGINRAIKDVNRFQRGVSNITRALSFFGGVFGLSFGGAAIARGLTRRIDQIDDLAKQADTTGVSLKSLGVNLDKSAVRKVQEAQRAIEGLREEWGKLRDELIVRVAPAITNVGKILRENGLSSLNPSNLAMQMFQITPPPSSSQIASQKAVTKTPFQLAQEASIERIDALRRHVGASRPRTTEASARILNEARQRISEERKDMMARVLADREQKQQMDGLRRAEILARRGIIMQRTSAPPRLIDSPLINRATPSERPSSIYTQERVWQKIEDNTFDAKKELERLNRLWEEELRRRQAEKESGGVSIN